MKSIVIVLSLIFSSLWIPFSVQAAEQTVMVVGAEFWAMPRHGEQLLAQAPLKAAVQQLLQEPEAYLVLNYPESESGELWGQEFQAWLVSLGVASNRIELRAGYDGDDGIAVILVMPDVEQPLAPLSIEQGAGVVDDLSVQENNSVGAAVGAGATTVQDEVESQ